MRLKTTKVGMETCAIPLSSRMIHDRLANILVDGDAIFNKLCTSNVPNLRAIRAEWEHTVADDMQLKGLQPYYA